MFKVMIVDDEPIFRQYMQTRLNWSELDMHVCCEAKHGIDALEQAEIHRPDIALIDINMPFMDGLQLSERLKSRFPDISIVLVTGHNEFEYARTALRIGVNDYLLKPFDKEEFLVTLHKVKFLLKATREERAVSKDHSQLSSSGNRLSKSNKLYEAAKEFIHTHYADPDLSVDGIAGHLYIDASYLRKIFKREGDMTVSDYLTYIRMQKAKKLISGNQIKLIDIAEKTGYRDPGYFSKCFKKQFGVTPTVYENRSRT